MFVSCVTVISDCLPTFCIAGAKALSARVHSPAWRGIRTALTEGEAEKTAHVAGVEKGHADRIAR